MATKPARVHLVWATTAAAAFGLGYGLSSRPESASEIAASVSSTSDLRASAGFGPKGGQGLQRDKGAGPSRNEGIEALFGSYQAGSVGLDALAEQAFRDPNPITRRLAFGQLLAAMTPENAQELREKILSLGARGDEWRDFHYSWGALAGREAFELALVSEVKDMAATMSGWAAANPTEAMAMLSKLPPEMAGSKAEVAEALIAGIADRDLALATDLALQLSADGTGRADRLIRSVAIEALRTGGPVEAASWAETLPDGDAKGAAMNRIAGEYVRDDPQAAASWIEQFADQPYAARAVAEVGEEWGERDPTSAVGWLESLPAGDGQSNGFRSVLGDWEDSDPVAASKYLAQMPPSPQRDAAVSGFARGYAWQDPEAAIAWAEDISDPGLRQQSLTQAGQAYFRRDPESAKAWLETSDLPDDAQQQVLNPRRRW